MRKKQNELKTKKNEKRLHIRETENKNKRCEPMGNRKHEYPRREQTDNNENKIAILKPVHHSNKNPQPSTIAMLSADHQAKKPKKSSKSMNESGVLLEKSIKIAEEGSASMNESGALLEKSIKIAEEGSASNNKSVLVVEQSNQAQKACPIVKKISSVPKIEDDVVESKPASESNRMKNEKESRFTESKSKNVNAQNNTIAPNAQNNTIAPSTSKNLFVSKNQQKSMNAMTEHNKAQSMNELQDTSSYSDENESNEYESDDVDVKNQPTNRMNWLLLELYDEINNDDILDEEPRVNKLERYIRATFGLNQVIQALDLKNDLLQMDLTTLEAYAKYDIKIKALKRSQCSNKESSPELAVDPQQQPPITSVSRSDSKSVCEFQSIINSTSRRDERSKAINIQRTNFFELKQKMMKNTIQYTFAPRKINSNAQSSNPQRTNEQSTNSASNNSPSPNTHNSNSVSTISEIGKAASSKQDEKAVVPALQQQLVEQQSKPRSKSSKRKHIPLKQQTLTQFARHPPKKKKKIANKKREESTRGKNLMSIDLACAQSNYGTQLDTDNEPTISDFHSSDSDFFSSDGDLFPVPEIAALPKKSDRLRLTKKWYALQKRKNKKMKTKQNKEKYQSKSKSSSNSNSKSKSSTNSKCKSSSNSKSKPKRKSKSMGKKLKMKEQIRSGYVHRVSQSKRSKKRYPREEPSSSSSSQEVDLIASNIHGFQKKKKKKTCVEFVSAFPGQGMRTGKRLLSVGRKKSQTKLLRTKFINCLEQKFL